MFIEASNITLYRKQTKVFDRLSIAIKEGERVAILGPNGGGKSSLLKLFAREIYPLSNNCSSFKIFDEEHINIQQLRERLAVVSQSLQEAYTPYSTGFDVVLSGLFGAIGKHSHLSPNAQQIERVQQVLASWHCDDFSEHMFQHLSTGQQRRLLIARALIREPNCLILDEPTSALDYQASFKLLSLISKQLNTAKRQQKPMTLIIATHHVNEILPEIDRIVLLKDGVIVADGPKNSVLTETYLSELYETPIKLEAHNDYFQVFPA